MRRISRPSHLCWEGGEEGVSLMTPPQGKARWENRWRGKRRSIRSTGGEDGELGRDGAGVKKKK